MKKTTAALVGVGSVVVITGVAVAVYEASVLYQHRKDEAKDILEALNEEGLEDA